MWLLVSRGQFEGEEGDGGDEGDESDEGDEGDEGEEGDGLSAPCAPGGHSRVTSQSELISDLLTVTSTPFTSFCSPGVTQKSDLVLA